MKTVFTVQRHIGMNPKAKCEIDIQQKKSSTARLQARDRVVLVLVYRFLLILEIAVLLLKFL